MWDWLRSERQKYRVPTKRIVLTNHASLTGLDHRGQELFGRALPRGVLLPRLKPDRERVNFWMSPGELLRHRFVPGQIMLGKFAGQYLGHMDDRPLVTFAQSRSGKTSTVIEPNLYLYPGSTLVLDPKGGISHLALYRRALGHQVHILDPFGQSGEPSSSFNPLSALDPDNLAIVDDVALIANALVPDDGDPRSRHWNDSARKLIIGVILLVLALEPDERNLVTVRELLCLSYPPLVEGARMVAAREAADEATDKRRKNFSANAQALEFLLRRMKALGPRFGGIAAAIGDRFLNMPEGERGNIFSTAATHTDFLDSLLLRRTLLRSDFRLDALRSDRPTTIFLCLPVARVEPHARWLRLIVQMCCIVLERMGPYPRDRTPILFLMEEFATLGHMQYMEHAAAYFPEFGVKLWAILQNLTQLQAHYKTGWETILGNAGLLQFFANGDGETLRYIESRLGKLIEPFELHSAFSRERQSQILLMAGMPPAAALRLEHEDVDTIRRQVLRAARDMTHQKPGQFRLPGQ
ncbi:type IV secretory system conjugative DNA transfer family protein [Bradyrhizobium sp. CCGUVB1N3]|uniref:type IV secretory system conjugative DNA transfer family protein n=1 Tax=Bradyrhizobium sp. CCGUVB1N3 TaxID=2949629 RepID=UPI0020B22BF6|nr:type IV secretory system conjugative DNA transfer family protein [Bradyrhizobium sp. CCGUVB1N3]MCP3477649.1 type IV secretory system conjugative DNA transfer family protein [Bradyrhizobium sp. CCGUVB1N3]